MIVYYTTGDVASMCGLSSATGRERIASGAWKHTAETRSGGALFSRAKALQIIIAEHGLNREDGTAAAEADVILNIWESATP